MTDPHASQPDTSRFRRIDDACDRHEAALRAGQDSRIEDYLNEARDADERVKMFADLLKVELQVRREKGEEPRTEEYQRRFPDYADVVAQVFERDRREDSDLASVNPFARTITAGQDALQQQADAGLDSPEGSAVANAPEPPRTHFGRYRVVGEALGEGGFGCVYRAVDEQTGQQVAVKLLRPQLLTDPDAKVEFHREAEKAGQLDHPHIVKVYAAGESDHGPYIVFQLIEGQNLKQWLDAPPIRETPLTPAQAVELLLPVIDAVAAAHRAGLVHRDLKPANILMDAAGKPYVTDFGLAASYRDLIRGAQHGGAGTPVYMAPEQLAGEGHRIGERTDIFALGVILYELLTGKHPFLLDLTKQERAQISAARYYKLVSERPLNSPRTYNPDVSLALGKACLKALERDPFQRFMDCAEFADELRRAIAPARPAAALAPRTAVSTEFQREYLVRLPLPLAQLYARAHNAKDARARYDSTFYLFEVLIKLATSTAVSAYLDGVERGQPRVPELDRCLAKLALPSLGQWVVMLRELARNFGQPSGAASHPVGHLWQLIGVARDDLPGMLELYRRIKHGPEGIPSDDTSCSILNVFEALVQYRSTVFGNAPPGFEQFYEREIGPLLFAAANELLADGTLEPIGPRGSRLVYLTAVRAVGDERVEVSLRELIGLQSERATALILSRDQAELLAANCVAASWPGHAVPVPLDPLVQYCETDLTDELLFLNRSRFGGQLEYLSYTTGRTEAAPAADVGRLLSRVLNREVTEQQTRSLAERSLVETPSVEMLLGKPSAEAVMGDYEILAEIGRGGMGIVYLVRQRSLGRLVALKRLPSDLAGDEVALARFRREVRHLARCDHPHIVKILSSGNQPDGTPYYTMEYIPGCDLELVWQLLSKSDAQVPAHALGSTTWASAVLSAARQKRDQLRTPSDRPQSTSTAQHDSAARLPAADASAPVTTGSDPANPQPRIENRQSKIENLLPPLPDLPNVTDDPGGYVRRVVTLIRDAALALQTVHDQHVIHRDVKPANLMLTPDGTRVVLMDFGLAKGASAGMTSRSAGGLLGTLRYAAPEQLAAATLTVGPPADVRGLGVTLWELLTRRRLFADAQDEAQLAARVHDDDVPKLRTLDPTLDRDLEAVVARSTERRVADRIPTTGQLASYLQLYLDGKPLPIRAAGAGERLWRWCRRKPLVASLIAAVWLSLLAGIGVSAYFATESHRHAEYADQKRQESDDNAKRATDEKNRADVKAEEARRNLYVAHMNLAQSNWEDARVGAVLELLDRYRESDLQGFEWHYWDRLCHSELLTLKGHTGDVRSVAFSPDGKRLASAGFDRTLKVWDATSGQETLTLNGHTGWVTSVAFGADGKRLASASHDQTVKVWDATSGQETLTLKGHTGGVTSVAFSADGKRLASASEDQTAKLWDATSGQETLTLKGHTGGVKSVAFSADGKRLASASDDRTVKLWDATSGQETLTLKGHSESVFSVAFSADGKRLASASLDDTVKVWDAMSGQETLTLKGHTGPVYSVAFSADGNRLVSASDDGTVKVWDATSGQEMLTLKGHTHAVTSVAFSTDGKRLASASGDDTVKVWDATRGQETLTLKGHTGGVKSVAFSADGKRLASASWDGTVKVWDATSGQKTLALKGHTGPVTSVAFSADGKRLASASEDQTAKLWDATSGQETLTLKGHTGTVRCVAFSPDGKRLASASWDGTVKLWDATSGQETLTLRGHTYGIESVAFSADGKRLASAGVDGTVKVWDARPWTQELRADQEARSLLSSLTTQLASQEALVRAVEQDTMVSEPARRRAIEWVGAFWNGFVSPPAEHLVQGMFARGFLKHEVVDAIAADPSYSEGVRSRALELARHGQEDANALNNASWSLLWQPNRAPAEYARALLQAEAACRIQPDNGPFLNTLGVAQYRSAKYDDALKTLTRSDEINTRDLGGSHPGDVTFLAMTQHQLGRTDESQKLLARLRQLRQDARWKNNLEAQAFLREAVALLNSLGSLQQEIRATRESLAQDPNNPKLLDRLAHLYVSLGVQQQPQNSDDAIQSFQEGIEIDQRLQTADDTDLRPLHRLVTSWGNLGVIYVGKEQFETARQSFQSAIRHAKSLQQFQPDSKASNEWLANSYANLAGVEHRLGLPAHEIASLTQGVEIYGSLLQADPANADLQLRLASCSLRLAWLLATTPRNDLRDGPQAFAHAQRACGLTQWNNNPAYLQTLAATHAELGNFADAVKRQKTSLELSGSWPQDEIANARARLELYQSGKPYREEPPPAAATDPPPPPLPEDASTAPR